MSHASALPVVIIGAGPVGLAAAAHVLARGMEPLVLEAGAAVGASMRQWAHIRMFSPWEYNVDRAAAVLLERSGWQAPDPATFPTGGDVVARYLEPLAATPEIASRITFGARVTAVAKLGRDRMKTADRDALPWQVRYTVDGEEHELVAQAVIDASGTLHSPNPIGASGIPALGEAAARHNVFYGMPDVLGSARSRFAGKRVLVIGSGHSAFNVLTDLARLQGEEAVRIEWAVRRPSLRRVLGGGENDQLKERGLLGLRIAALVDTGAVRLHAGVHVDRIERMPDGLVTWSGGKALPAVDEIVATTGFRPDLSLLAEARTDLDAGTQAPSALAPLIDPNLHSCGTVRPHGALELKHPDSNLYIVGMKSYGRAPTFLLLTGYEQVRSVAAAIAGDWEAARRVELVLPETGVCSTQFDAEEAAAACCAAPAAAAGASGCQGTTPAGGCGSRATEAAPDATVASGCEVATPEAGCGSRVPEAVPKVAEASCCGGPAPEGSDACCRQDAEAKAAGGAGCGCADRFTAPSSTHAAGAPAPCCDTRRAA